MTAALVTSGIHTDAFGSIAQNFLKPIAIPTAGAEAPGDVVSAVITEPNFHLSPRVVLAIVLATVLLSALAIMMVASLAPQGFAAGS